MACFLVPAGEAAVTTVVGKLGGKKSRGAAHEQAGTGFGRKLKWLSNMLWDGSALLAFEHVWHGELTLWFPFLSAMNNPADTAEMLAEMGSVGVAMAAGVTLVWVGMVTVSAVLEKRAQSNEPVEEAQ